MMEPNSMTTMQDGASTKGYPKASAVGWLVEIGYAALVMTPILMLCLMFSSSVLMSLRNRGLIQRSLVQMKIFDQPEANPSLVQWHAQETSTDHTRRHLEFESAVNFVALHSFLLNEPRVATELVRVVPKDAPWEAAKLVSTLALNGSSVVAEFDALPTPDTPVWKPLNYDRFDDRRPFGDARYVMWEVLRVEFQDAFHKGEMDRALKAILHLERFCATPSQSFLPPAEMFYRSQWLELIGKSIQYEQWSQGHLGQLQAVLSQPDDFGDVWHQTLATDALLALPWAYDRQRMAMFEPNSTQYGALHERPTKRQIEMSSVAPSEAFELFGVLEQIAGSESEETPVGGEAHRNLVAGFVHLTKREAYQSLHISQSNTADQQLKLPFAKAAPLQPWYTTNYPAFLGAMMQVTQRRSFLHAAIAIRHFEATTGQMPKKLEQLVKVGVDDETIGQYENELRYEFEPFEKNGTWRLTTTAAYDRLQLIADEIKRYAEWRKELSRSNSSIAPYSRIGIRASRPLGIGDDLTARGNPLLLNPIERFINRHPPNFEESLDVEFRQLDAK